MPNYIQDPNNSKKQIPGQKTDQHFDRVSAQAACSYSRQPHYVIVTAAETTAFFFGSSASFASKATSEGPENTVLTGSQHYISYGAPAIGTKFDMNPCAWSGSADASVTFVYKGGLDGLGRP